THREVEIALPCTIIMRRLNESYRRVVEMTDECPQERGFGVIIGVYDGDQARPRICMLRREIQSPTLCAFEIVDMEKAELATEHSAMSLDGEPKSRIFRIIVDDDDFVIAVF